MNRKCFLAFQRMLERHMHVADFDDIIEAGREIGNDLFRAAAVAVFLLQMASADYFNRQRRRDHGYR